MRNFMRILVCVLSITALAPALALAQMPVVQTANGIQYLNGGMGTEEREAIRCDFPLKLEFANTGGGYISMVTVRIFDSTGNKIFDIVANNGPWLFVKLPAGRYGVEAVFRGIEKKLDVDIRGREDRKVFTIEWPAR
ncbi:MAG: carboxypeptidase regulatory-like domain-containing protein [Acidobacteriota bacterium]